MFGSGTQKENNRFLAVTFLVRTYCLKKNPHSLKQRVYYHCNKMTLSWRACDIATIPK